MLNRRKFLKLGAAGAIITMSGVSAPLFVAQSFASASAGGILAGGQRALVIVELAGGNDGLNTVIPFGDSEYYRLRPTLGIPAAQVLKLNDGLGFHPSLTGLRDMFAQGQLAIVQGVGYPNPDFSHFVAHDIWASAQPGSQLDRTGWLGRYLQNQPNPGQIATSLTGDSPLTLYSQTTLVPAINGLDNFYFQADDYYDGDGATRRTLAHQIYSRVDNNLVAEYIRSSALDALNTADALTRYSQQLAPQSGYPESDLGNQLMAVSGLLKAELDFRVFYVRIGSFDTHADQLSVQADLLKDLSDSLSAFYADLKKAGLHEQVVTMTFSEFGRRPAENGSGTDHGSAEPLFIIGGHLKGGLYGTPPSLTNLDDGNLRYGLDFRQVYATVLKDWLNVDPTGVLGAGWSNPLPLW